MDESYNKQLIMMKKILIVEDEPIIADDLAFIIQDFGYEVFEPCMDVREAELCISDSIPDLALIDINLKGDLNGIDLARLINSKYHFPFIFLTSVGDKASMTEIHATQPIALVGKPFKERELKRTIEMAFRQRTS